MRPELDTPSPAPSAPFRHRLLLFVVVAASRFAFAADRVVFQVFPDEPGMLAMARWFSRTGQPWSMGWSSVWQPGYSALIAPVFWISGDQHDQIRLSLAVGAALGGAAAALLLGLTHRLTSLTPRAAAVVCGLVSSMPSAMSASAHVWAEPLVTVLFLAALTLLLRLVHVPSITLGLAAITTSVAAYWVHGRMLPLVAITLAVAGVGLWRAHGAVWTLLAAVVTVVQVGAVALTTRVVHDTLWVDPTEINSIGAVLDRTTDPVSVLESAIGQIWYLVVSTVGLAGIGAVALARRAWRSDRSSVRLDALVVLVVTVPLILLSIVFVAGRERLDQQIYGRYNDAIIWPIVVVGVGWVVARVPSGSSRLARRDGRVLVSAVVAQLSLGVIVAVMLATRQSNVLVVPEMVAGIVPFMMGSTALNAAAVTIVSAGVGAGLVAIVLSRARRVLVVATAVAVVGLGAVATHRSLARDLNQFDASSDVSRLDGAVIPAGADVTYGFVAPQHDPSLPTELQGLYVQIYQWYLPSHRFHLTPVGDYPTSGFVFAPLNDPFVDRSNACVVWRDPTAEIGLWAIGHTDCEDA